MSRSEFRRDFLAGLVLGMSFLTLFFVFFVADDPVKPQTEPKSKFEVVDSYENCNVVRYDDAKMATYKYFLHCPNN